MLGTRGEIQTGPVTKDGRGSGWQSWAWTVLSLPLCTAAPTCQVPGAPPSAGVKGWGLLALVFPVNAFTLLGAMGILAGPPALVFNFNNRMPSHCS